MRLALRRRSGVGGWVDVDEDDAYQGKSTPADLGECERGVIDGAEGVSGDEEDRESEGGGEVRRRELLAVGR